MDYGPVVFNTFRVPWPVNKEKGTDNTVKRGIAVRLRGPNGEEGGVCYDAEMLRFSAGWFGGFLERTGISFDGKQDVIPGIRGDQRFGTDPATPGWAGPDGNWSDPRPTPYGRLPDNWAKYRGVFLNGDRVVVSYGVGDCGVLEMPLMEGGDSLRGVSRTLRLEPSGKPQALLVCDAPEGGEVEVVGVPPPPTDGVTNLTVVGAVALPQGSTWEVREHRRIILTIPPRKDPVTFKIVMWNTVLEGKDRDKEARAVNDHFLRLLNMASRVEDVERLCHGGPPRWKDAVGTHGVLSPITTFVPTTLPATAPATTPATAPATTRAATLAATQAASPATAPATAPTTIPAPPPGPPYVVDTLAIPEANPWHSWMRLAAFDFFPGGASAAVSTLSGDVWIVSGIDERLENLTWKRFATGLYQPLGLKIIDGVVNVTCRDAIYRLRDLNNDGEADDYECFNNDWQISTHYHEFCFDLETDKDGNVYFVKGGPVRLPDERFTLVLPHFGVMMQISKDGRQSSVYATGFRAPNGMSIGPGGEITCSDNQGTWTPNSRINLIEKGGFYGNLDFFHGTTRPADYDKPIVWLPLEFDNSPSGQVWVTSDRWGPLRGKLLSLSYGKSGLYEVMTETVHGQIQGAAVRFPLTFDSGLMRGRFNERDGQLYVVGLQGWQSSAARVGCFQRIRYTGRGVNMPVELHVAGPREVAITFTAPLDPSSAADAESYAIEQWNYVWGPKYGSPDIRPSKPGRQGRDVVELAGVWLSGDGKTVHLATAGRLDPVMQMKIRLDLRAADGEKISYDVYNTINRVPGE
jgi:glucose/arabinose dehydrogenase